MHCEGKLKLWSNNTIYCLIEVVTKAGPENKCSLGSKKYELVIRHSETMGDNS
jgi:hypothetical protein